MGRFRHGLLLVAWLAVPAMCLPSLFLSPAYAQESLFESDVLQLVPIGEVIGDGLTPVTLHLLALDANGQAFQTPELRLQTTGGRISLPEEVSPGVYKVVWIPPAVTQDRMLHINLKGKTLDKKRLKGSWAFPVLAPLAQQVALGANPPQVVLGQDDATTVNIDLSGGAVGNVEGADLQLRASTGGLGPFVPLGEGRYTVRYLTPEERYPHYALVTTADRRAPAMTYGSMVIPLVGTIAQPVSGHPDGRVLVRVGEREFGPFELDSRGMGSVDLAVPPGVEQITVISIKDGERLEEQRTLQIPAWKRLLLIPGHRSVPADPGLQVPIRVFVVDSKGRPDGEASPVLTADQGEVSGLVHEGAGIYSGIWTPPASAVGGTVRLSVQLEALEQEDAVEIDLLPLRPARLVLSTDPEILGEADKEFQLKAQVLDDTGTGLEGRDLSLQTVGSKVLSGPQDQGSGNYTAQLTAKGLAAEVLVTVKTPASQNPVQQVVVLPTRKRLLNDGLSSTMLTVLTLDEFGYPVTDQEVKVKLVQGDGSVPETARTDSAGIAQVHYTAGRSAAIVQIQVIAGGHTTAVGLLQLPRDSAPDLVLPPSGSQTMLDMAQAWSAIVGFMRIERSGFE
jgi:hypothetical protein